MFKKTCYSCGAKVNELYDGICGSCLKEQRPPIREVKHLNFKICNMSKKIKYKNYFYEQEEIEKMIPDIMKKQVIIDEAYKLKDLKVKNFEINGHNVSFDVEVDCDLK